jgi:hypothetical protein
MSKGKGWDLTSLHSLEGAAEWIRKNSDALLVLVVRREDIAFAVHEDVRPFEAIQMVELVLPATQAQLEERREEARLKAAGKRKGSDGR